jgi:hypothetical protein
MPSPQDYVSCGDASGSSGRGDMVDHETVDTPRLRLHTRTEMTDM